MFYSVVVFAETPVFVAEGVVCDTHFCADSRGISAELTKKHLGKKKAGKIESALPHITTTEFTFSNGVHCDSLVKKCYDNRYFDASGNRSEINKKFTEWLYHPRGKVIF